ncbi:uncharacterized protein [Rutidosis leptorrhynchoides]|uniref:uncharacterized protein n=1 Tax=Rutidosis leptorrhynchoides TaxID=125765 RepID=UPI003A9928A0
MATQEEAEVKKADSKMTESETPKNETRVSREGDSSKSLDSPTHPKRVLTQPHQQARGGTKSNTSSPMWERKGSSDGTHITPTSTPGRSRLKQVTLGDESPDDSTAVPVFGDWDDSNPASAEGYSHIFNKVREEKHGGGGKSPRISSNDTQFYGQRKPEKGCSCFPWGRK